MNAIQIGVDKGAIAEARAAINDILAAAVDQSTKVAALDALRSICLVKDTTVTNCQFTVGGAE